MESEIQEQRSILVPLQEIFCVNTPSDILPAAQDLFRDYRKVRKELAQLRKSLDEALKAKQEAIASYQASVDALADVIARQAPIFVHGRSRSQSRKRPREETSDPTLVVDPSSSSHIVSIASMESSEAWTMVVYEPPGSVPVESPGISPVETPKDIPVETPTCSDSPVRGYCPPPTAVRDSDVIILGFPGATPVFSQVFSTRELAVGSTSPVVSTSA
jgi:hypothetical protein